MSQVQALEHQLRSTQQLQEFAEKIRQLIQTPLYREVIVEQFTNRECARYVQESADPSLTAEQRADALGMAQASGYLKRWIAVTLQMADIAARDIPNLQEQIEYARQEAGE